jgi:hypothetical protein
VKVFKPQSITEINMCSLDYENILNPQQTPENAKSMEDGDKDEEFVKTMEGPGDYFRQPGGYIVDMRDRK